MIKLKDIKKITIIGSGIIGSGWGICYALRGYKVSMYDINAQQLENGKHIFAENLRSLIELNAVTQQQADDANAAVTWTTDLESALENSFFIQENGPENLDIKRSILASIEKIASAEAVYASSTSGLKISDISKEALHPERCVGAHPYNPAHIIPLVELTKSLETDDSYLSLAREFYQSVGKEVVILQRECPGYIANRLQLALGREAQDLILRGICTAEDVDKAVIYGPGLRWAIFGPNMIMQLCSPKGLKEVYKNFKGADIWLQDMAKWTEQPENFAEIAQKQVDEMMKNFPDEIGHTNEECSHYRDQMIVDILKLHGKF